MASSTPTLQHPSNETQKFRSHMGQISRQSGIFFTGTLFTLGAGYLFKVYLARVLGAEALGIYALGMTMVGFFGIFNSLGLPESAVRFVAAYGASGQTSKLRHFLWRSTNLLFAANALFMTAFLVAGFWIARHLYHSPALAPFLLLFAFFLPFSAIRTFLEKSMAGYRDISRRTLIVNFLGTPTTIILTILLISFGLGLKGYLYGQIGSSALVVLLLGITVWQLTPPALDEKKSPVETFDPEVRSFSAVVLGMGFLAFLINQADKIALGYFLGAKQVGIYAMAAALVAYVPIVLTSVNQIFAPTISDLHTRGDHLLLLRLFQTITKWVVALTIPLATVLIVFARPVMSVFGHDFEVGWPILIIGTVGELVNCGVGSVGYLLLMSGQQRRLMKIQMVAAMVAVAMNLLCIPVWGIIGAAAASATVNVITNLWYLREVRSVLKLSPYNRSYLKLMVPAIITGCAVWFFHSASMHWTHVIASIVAALLLSYTVFLAGFACLGLTADDHMIIKTARQRFEAFFAH